MRGWFKKAFAIGIVASTVPFFGSCTNDDTGIFVLANLARVAPACTVKIALDSAFFSRGVLDVTLRDFYIADLMWGNQMIERNEANLSRTETSTFTVEGAEIMISHGTELLRHFSVASSGVANPTASTDPGLGLSAVELLPADVVINQIAPLVTSTSDRVQIIVDVKIFGSTIGGISSETPFFRYVIDVCRSCLIVFEPTFGATPVCASKADVQAPCYIGQNDPVPCQSCVNMFAPVASENPCLEP